MVRENFTEKVQFEWSTEGSEKESHAPSLEKTILGRKNSKCKTLEGVAGKGKEAREVTAQWEARELKAGYTRLLRI